MLFSTSLSCSLYTKLTPSGGRQQCQCLLGLLLTALFCTCLSAHFMDVFREVPGSYPPKCIKLCPNSIIRLQIWNPPNFFAVSLAACCLSYSSEHFYLVLCWEYYACTSVLPHSLTISNGMSARLSSLLPAGFCSCAYRCTLAWSLLVCISCLWFQ